MSAIKTVHDAEYATANLGERIVAALKDAGIPPEKWTPEILG